MNVIGNMISSTISSLFLLFVVILLGTMLGHIKIKNISLGAAGILIVGLWYGVFVHYFPSFKCGNFEILLYNDALKKEFQLISNMGAALFVTAIGLTAGPDFFHVLSKKNMAYMVLGIIIILSSGAMAVLIYILDKTINPSMMVGLLTGALTSTPGLTAAKEMANISNADDIVAGYGTAYIFGVIGVVLFVQIIPFIFQDGTRSNEKKEIISHVHEDITKKNYIRIDSDGIFTFLLTIVVGYIIGAIRIPCVNFSFGTSGGTLIAGLIIGNLGHIGKFDCHIRKEELQLLRHLGLVLFLSGSGIPAGVNFLKKAQYLYFLYGMVLTLLPMFVGFLIAYYVFHLDLIECLGTITGGMTSTPALGILLANTGSDKAMNAYAATYPMAMVTIVILAKVLMSIFGL